MVGTDWIEMYNKYRLRDLGFKGMSAYQQAEKVLKEYAEGKRGISAFYAECYRVMLIERKIWQQESGFIAQQLPEVLFNAMERFDKSIENELEHPSKGVRKQRQLRGRRRWRKQG